MDKRKIDRRYLSYYTRVYDADDHKQIGNLVDITPTGIMVVCDKPIPQGNTLRIRLELTAEVADKPFMEFTACSKWSQPDIGPNLYNNGFEIVEISPDDTKIIQRIVKEFGFRDNKPET